MNRKRSTATNLGDVAGRAGVSMATASMVMNNYANISASARKRVFESARALGYAPKARGGGAKTRRDPADVAGKIAFVVCGGKNLAANPYYFAITSNASEQLKASRRSMVFCHWSVEEMEQLLFPSELLDRDISGVILTGRLQDSALMMLRAHQLPTVLAATNLKRLDYDFVGADNFRTVKMAYQYLRQRGHRKILAFLGDPEHVDWQEKKQMYLALMAEDGLTPAFLCSAGQSESQLWDEFQRTMPDATAVLATSDFLGIMLLRILHGHGIRCPEDVSIIGIDNVPMSENAIPPLTTVDPDLSAIGLFAAHRLMARLEQPDLPYGTIAPSPRLIERASCIDLKE